MMADNYQEMLVPKEIMHGLDRTARELAGLDLDEFVDKELYKPSIHLLSIKGKMLRPALVFMGGFYSGSERMDDLVDIATAVELLHTSSLIHDDMIDKDKERRGTDATHVKYGTELALLAGDALISSAIRRISGYGQAVIDRMARTAMEMAAGEALDFKFQKSGEVPTVEQYRRIAYLKSASLISTSSCIAAVSDSGNNADALEEFGRNFGMAFQIRDDVCDFTENGEDTLPHPNIVRSIMQSGIHRDSAIRKAIGMNREYIDRGLGALDRRKKGMFERYSSSITLDEKDIEDKKALSLKEE